MEQKQCIACKVTKPIDAFALTPQGDRVNRCGECNPAWFPKGKRKKKPHATLTDEDIDFQVNQLGKGDY